MVPTTMSQLEHPADAEWADHRRTTRVQTSLVSTSLVSTSLVRRTMAPTELTKMAMTTQAHPPWADGGATPADHRRTVPGHAA